MHHKNETTTQQQSNNVEDTPQVNALSDVDDNLQVSNYPKSHFKISFLK